MMDDSRDGRYKRRQKQERRLAQQRQRRKKQKVSRPIASRDAPTESKETTSGTEGRLGAEVTTRNRNQYMREYMRKRRAEMSRQKMKAVRVKGRKRKTPRTVEQSGTRTGATTNRKHNNGQAVLLESPEKFADIIDGVLNTSTPKKVEALKKRGIPASKEERKRFRLLSDFGEETFKLSTSCKKKKTNVSKIFQRSLNQTIANTVRRKYGYCKTVRGKNHTWNFASKCFGINWRQKGKTSTSSLRRERGDATPNLVKTRVTNFYKSPQVSQTRPDKKLGKSGQPSYIMHLTYRKAYELWKKENPIAKLGFTKFYHLKPKNVKPRSFAQHIGCLCVYCVNIQEKLKSIDYKIRSMKKEEELKESRISSEHKLYQMLLCEKLDTNRFHNPQCVNGTCEKCNCLGKTITTYYNDFMKEAGDDKIMWKKWEVEKVTYPKKEGQKIVQKEASRRVFKNKEGTAKELIEELVCDVVSPTKGTTFITHLFQASWQIYQVEKTLKEAVRAQTVPGIVMVIQDFGRNFSAKYQDEIKSAHWVKKEVTIHPMVAYHVDPGNGKFTRDSLVMLSDDLTHDHHIVEHFQHVAHDHLKNVRGLDIQLLVQINDGCANQYKKAAAFADVSCSVDEFGYIIERGYYGSEHGKGESDGETSVVKGQAEKAILSRKAVIHTAETMYEFCKENLSLEGEDKGTHQSRRSFFLVKKDEVNRSRPERCDGLRAVPHTRKLHSIRSTQAPFIINTRQLSCFCTHCLQGVTEKYSNTAYTGSWREANLKLEVDYQTRKMTKQGKKKEEKRKKNKKRKTLHLADNGSGQGHINETTTKPAEESQQGRKGVSVNDYVAIHFDAPTSSKNTSAKGIVFMALVTAVRNGHAQVKFMCRNNSGLYYFTGELEALHPNSDIVYKMTQPTMTQACRAYLYKFDQGELDMLANKFSLK